MGDFLAIKAKGQQAENCKGKAFTEYFFLTPSGPTVKLFYQSPAKFTLLFQGRCHGAHARDFPFDVSVGCAGTCYRPYGSLSMHNQTGF
jgi:hypothetical protein